MQKQVKSETIADRLYEIRCRRDLSYRIAAELVGVAGVSWYNWENGHTQPKAAHIKSICQAFNVSADWLLGLEDRDD